MSVVPTSLTPAESSDRMLGLSRPQWKAVLLLVLLLGIIFRLGQYLSDRSYWHDEAFLVLNIFEKDAHQLMGPLDVRSRSPQAAPPLFLLAQRGMYQWLGGSEFVMRLIPMLLGAGALLLMGLLTWQWLAPPAAVFATALFAFSDRIIWHASEAKQYSGDIFFAVLLIWLAFGCMKRPRSVARTLWICSLVAAACMWMSHSVVFVFGGISLALLPPLIRQRRIAHWIAANIPAVASFAALYLLSIRVQQNVVLKDYWATRFLDWSHPLHWPIWFVGELGKLFDYPCTNFGWLLIILCILASIALWKRHQWSVIILLFSPIALVLAAACAHAYPFGGHRLTVFLGPAIFLGAGFGLQYLLEWRPTHDRIAGLGLILSGVAVCAGLGIGTFHLFAPRTRDHLRPAVAYLRHHYQPGDGVIALNPEEFLCYWRPAPQPWVAAGRGESTIPASWKRFWIIGDTGDRDERAEWTRWLGQTKERGDAPASQSYHAHRAKVLLFTAPDK